MTCPRQQPGQSFDDHQREVAEWIGCSVGRMNRDHDALHASLCAWLGIPSHSLACAAGRPNDPDLAAMEEGAVMHVQRLLTHHGVGVPA